MVAIEAMLSLSTGVSVAGDPGILVQIAQGAQPEGVPPTLPAMFGRIMNHVAALAERAQVRRSAVARIMIEVRTRQDDIGHPDARKREAALHRDTLALVRSPARRIGVPPAPVAKMRDPTKVRPTALLAAPSGTLEPDRT